MTSMNSTETIFLVMADAERRACCFAKLAGQPQRIVRGFADARDAAAALDGHDSGCLVIDPGGFPGAMVEQLLRAAAKQPALITLYLADRLEAREAIALVQAHPSDIMPHDSDSPAIAARITLLLPMAAQRGAYWRDRDAATSALGRLSPREATVLAALATGQTSKDIARTLNVSPRTIEVHRASIMRRTNTATLAHLLRLHFLVAFSGDLSSGAIASKAA